MRRSVRNFAVGGAALLGMGLLSACEAVNTVSRPGSPVVLTGTDLPELVGAAPGRIVAFRYSSLNDQPVWTQVPVQVDERKVVGFGSQPSSNSTAGVTGTVYGSVSTGVTALQYADPNTFVGADADPAFDADDELVFMAFDMGGRRAGSDSSIPAGVLAGSGVAVEVEDPLAPGDERQRGWVYLFESTGGLDPSAGLDYVDYDFELVSGDYRTTYQRADGPNPEASSVVTPTYEAHFTDRWMETVWEVHAPGASGVDLLDGHKNQFAIGVCGRSNATFAAAEGAFVANIDGPVRAIRSYVGANSGPLTQRTHLMYRDRQDVITDLRVHAIPSVMDFIDLSESAVGSTYRSSTLPGGVTVDGSNETVPAELPDWESVNGSGGHVLMKSSYETDVSSFDLQTFYRDQVSPPDNECWGDGSYYGAAGSHVTSAIPNTDPRSGTFAHVQAARTVQFAPPVDDESQIAAIAEDWASDLENDVQVTATALP